MNPKTIADKQFGVRLPGEIANKINVIVAEINKRVPEADVTVSSLLRYAIQEYINRYEKDDLT